jgi:TPR repeat protein
LRKLIVVLALLGLAVDGAAQTTLQRCIGVVPGQEPKRNLGESPATVAWCQQLPGWSQYDQARQRFEAGDHAGAVRLLEHSAQAGNPLAQFRLAMAYRQGDGVPMNGPAEIRWLQAAAAQGEPASEDLLGTVYEYGQSRNFGVADNWDTAARLWQSAAAQGWRKGEFSLGRAYQYGIGVPLNFQSAISWYEKAAAQGDSQAAYFGKYLRDNHGFDGTTRDDDERALLGPLVGRTVPFMPPVGLIFHHLAERQSFVKNEYLGQERAKAEAYYQIRLRQYKDCTAAGGNNCLPPGSPPR